MRQTTGYVLSNIIFSPKEEIVIRNRHVFVQLFMFIVQFIGDKNMMDNPARSLLPLVVMGLFVIAHAETG